MLEVPYDRLLEEPKKFEILEVPYIPNIEVFDFMLDDVWEIAHEITEQLYYQANRNHLRRYLYNLLSSNNFTNQHFKNVYQLVHDEVFRQYQNNPLIKMSDAIHRATDMVLRGYLAMISVNEPELMKAVDKNIAMSLYKALGTLSVHKTTYRNNRQSLLSNNLGDYTPCYPYNDRPKESSNFDLYKQDNDGNYWEDLDARYENTFTNNSTNDHNTLKQSWDKYQKLLKRTSMENIQTYFVDTYRKAMKYKELFLSNEPVNGESEMYYNPNMSYRDNVLMNEQNNAQQPTQQQAYTQQQAFQQPMQQQSIPVQQQAFQQPMQQAYTQQQAFQQPVQQTAAEVLPTVDISGNPIYYDSNGMPYQQLPDGNYYYMTNADYQAAHRAANRPRSGFQPTAGVTTQQTPIVGATGGMFQTNIHQSETSVSIDGRPQDNRFEVNPLVDIELKNQRKTQHKSTDEIKAELNELIKEEVAKERQKIMEEFGINPNTIHKQEKFKVKTSYDMNHQVHKTPNIEVSNSFNTSKTTDYNLFDDDFNNSFNQEEKDMDRNKHTISVLGGRVEVTKSQPKNIEEIIEIANRKPANPKAKLEGAEVKDDQVPVNGTSSDEFVQKAVIKSFKNKLVNKDKETVQMVTGMINHPILIRSEHREYLDRILNSNSMFGMVENMEFIIREQQKKDGFGDKNLLMMLREINTKFTISINKFLEHNLATGITMDDFMGDCQELVVHLKKKNKELYGAFRLYETEVIEAFRSKNSEKYHEELLKENNMPAGTDVGFIKTSATFLDIPVASDELGLDKLEKEVVVDNNNLPNLHSMLTNAALHEEAVGKSGINKFIRTADGIVYEVFLNYVTNNSFKLILHN